MDIRKRLGDEWMDRREKELFRFSLLSNQYSIPGKLARAVHSFVFMCIFSLAIASQIFATLPGPEKWLPSSDRYLYSMLHIDVLAKSCGMASLLMFWKPVRRKTTPAKTWDARKAAAQKKVEAVRKQTAKKRTAQDAKFHESQHPRDKFGRFMTKAWGGTVKVVKGTIKTAKKLHRTVKSVNANRRRNEAYDRRKRNVELSEREKNLGIRKRKVVRRRKK